MNGPAEGAALPLWVELSTSLLAVTGGLAALVGLLGLLRLRSFFQRCHAPTLISTAGTWSLTMATVLLLSFAREQFFAHGLLVGLFIVLTAPVTTIFLMRAALFRRRTTGKEAPPPLLVSTPPPPPNPR